MPSDHEMYLGMLGTHGKPVANRALHDADLVIVCGARLGDRAVAAPDQMSEGTTVIHIDIDPVEIDKVREAQVPIVGDVKRVMASILDELEKIEASPDTDDWRAQIRAWKARYPLYDESVADDPDELVPERAMQELSRALDPMHSIVVTEVGQHQMWAAQFIDREQPRTFISSGGLGTMGFGFPAAVGAAIGCPDKTIVCIAGDGSFQMNAQEMATATINSAPVKVVVVNNRALGMVRQWQTMFYGKRYSASELDCVPDFVKLADAYGWKAERVEAPGDVAGAFARMLETPGPYLVDLVIGRDQNVFPMVRPGAGLDDVIGVIDAGIGREFDASSSLEEGGAR